MRTEGLIKHLFSRTPSQELGLPILLTLFAIYAVTHALAFGLAIPCGNFIPSMTLGATLGRILGEALLLGGLVGPADRGTYALIGAAAVLGGVTRMTITLAVILLSDTMMTEPPCSST